VVTFITRPLTAIILFFVMIPALAANLQSRVDRQQMGSGETIELTVSLDKQVLFGEPDFSSVEKNFDIVGRNRRSRISFVNGEKQSYTQWILTLSPKRAGTLVIPSFNFKGEVSDALEIKVRKPTATTDPGAAVFTESILEKNSVYVQEQALLTLRLYTTLSLSNFSMSEISIPNAQVVKLAEEQYQKQIAGIDYIVVETRLAIFVDNSGEVSIPSVRYSGIASERSNPYGSIWSRRGGKRLAVNTEEKVLSVKPRAAHATMNDWLPAREVKLYDRWSEGKPTLTVGEPVTRTIALSAAGLTGAQLPPFSSNESVDRSEGFKVYDDQPQLEDKIGVQGITGTRVESMAIVPTQAGTLTLPEIRVQWWDTVNDQLRETVLASTSFEVLPSADITASQPGLPAAALTQENPATTPLSGSIAPAENSWLVIILAVTNGILILITAVFAVLWWRGRQLNDYGAETANKQALTGNKLFKEIRVAAASTNYSALREAIIQWARSHWRDQHIHTLEQIASQVNGIDLKPQFQQLDACLYDKHNGAITPPDLVTLVDQLEKIHKTTFPDDPLAGNNHSGKKQKTQELLPLYPE